MHEEKHRQIENIIIPTEAYEDYLKNSKWQGFRSCIIPDINTDNDLMLKGKRKSNYKKAFKYLRKVVKYLPKELKIELKLEQDNERN